MCYCRFIARSEQCAPKNTPVRTVFLKERICLLDMGGGGGIDATVHFLVCRSLYGQICIPPVKTVTPGFWTNYVPTDLVIYLNVLYLSGTVRIAPSPWVFSGCNHCCAICAQCVSRRGCMWGIFGKTLKRAIWNTLGLHVVLTTCLRFSSVLDMACVACCLFLSTGSYHVRKQIHSTGCCFTTETLVRKRVRSRGVKWVQWVVLSG